MKKIDFGQTVSILANIGVIAGIIFLAIEVQQNNTLMRAQTRSDIARDISGMLLGNAHSPFLEEMAFPEELQAYGGNTGQFRRAIASNAMFRIWENMHYQHRMGLYDDAEFRFELEAWRGNLAQEPIKSIWCSSRPSFSPEFVETVASLLETPCE